MADPVTALDLRRIENWPEEAVIESAFLNPGGMMQVPSRSGKQAYLFWYDPPAHLFHFMDESGERKVGLEMAEMIASASPSLTVTGGGSVIYTPSPAGLKRPAEAKEYRAPTRKPATYRETKKAAQTPLERAEGASRKREEVAQARDREAEALCRALDGAVWPCRIDVFS